MADMGEVDADLVGAPGLERARELAGQRFALGVVVAGQHLVVGDGMPAVVAMLRRRSWCGAKRCAPSGTSILPRWWGGPPQANAR